MTLVRVPEWEPSSSRNEIENKLSQLFRREQLADVALSTTFARVLLESTRIASLKTADKDVVSTTTFFLTAALIAGRISEGAADAEMTQLREWGNRLKPLERVLTNWYGTYFGSSPTPNLDRANEPESYLVDGLSLGPGIRQNFATADRSNDLEVLPFLLRLANDRETGLYGNIRENDQRSEILATLRQLPNRPTPPIAIDSGAPTNSSDVPSGRSLEMYREANDRELGLGVADYALALATVLRAATGEFTFALFGRWGSGKTTLTKVLEPLLAEPGRYQERAKDASGVYAERRYAVVRHNAWKYRTPPEAWIYVYKSLADAASRDKGWIGRLLLAARKTFQRRGPWPATFALLLLALLLAPFGIKLHLLGVAVSVLGFSTVMHLSSVGASASRRVRELFADYMSVASHDAKLGMLAIIGDDVRTLLAAWTAPLKGDTKGQPGPRTRLGRLFWPLFIIAVTAAAWFAGLNSPSGLGDTWLIKELPSIVPDAVTEFFKGSVASTGASFGDWLLALAWLSLSIILLPLPWLWPSKRPHRVLLIVDDLDRCTPDEMLDVIESMKLLVDDPDIHNRLQILMLVDETVLNHAIALRYRTMIEDRASGMTSTDMDADRIRRARNEIIAEQNEKLFACSMRLAPLTETDVVSLVAGLANPNVLEARIAALRKIQDDAIDAERKRQERLAEARGKLEAAQRAVRDVGAREDEPHVTPNATMPRKFGPMRGVIDEPMVTPGEQERVDKLNRKIDERNAARRSKSATERAREQSGIVEQLRNAQEEYEQLEQEATSATTDTLAPGSVGFGIKDERFTEAEVAELESQIPDYLRATGRQPSPRAIRVLLFKIQLCRFLLQIRLPNAPRGRRSIRSILNTFEESSKPGEGSRSVEAMIAGQVI